MIPHPATAPASRPPPHPPPPPRSRRPPPACRGPPKRHPRHRLRSHHLNRNHEPPRELIQLLNLMLGRGRGDHRFRIALEQHRSRETHGVRGVAPRRLAQHIVRRQI